jgi:hypothetical protein
MMGGKGSGSYMMSKRGKKEHSEFMRNVEKSMSKLKNMVNLSQQILAGGRLFAEKASKTASYKHVPTTIYVRLLYGMYCSGQGFRTWLSQPSPVIQLDLLSKPARALINGKPVLICDKTEQTMWEYVVVGYNKTAPQSIDIYHYFKNRSSALLSIEHEFNKMTLEGEEGAIRINTELLRDLRAYDLIVNQHFDELYVKKLMNVSYPSWIYRHKAIHEYTRNLTLADVVNNMMAFRKG